jgi:hypothetical protein
MNRPLAASPFLAAASLALVGCASMSRGEVRWEPTVAWEGDAAIERIRAGRPDPSDPRLELVGVDQAGTVIRVRFDGDVPRS